MKLRFHPRNLRFRGRFERVFLCCIASWSLRRFRVLSWCGSRVTKCGGGSRGVFLSDQTVAPLDYDSPLSLERRCSWAISMTGWRRRGGMRYRNEDTVRPSLVCRGFRRSNTACRSLRSQRTLAWLHRQYFWLRYLVYLRHHTRSAILNQAARPSTHQAYWLDVDDTSMNGRDGCNTPWSVATTRSVFCRRQRHSQ